MKTNASQKHATVEECMDVLDWFSDPLYDYIAHVQLSKCNANERITRALPSLIEHVSALINDHIDLEDAYPVEYLTQPA